MEEEAEEVEAVETALAAANHQISLTVERTYDGECDDDNSEDEETEEEEEEVDDDKE